MARWERFSQLTEALDATQGFTLKAWPPEQSDDTTVAQVARPFGRLRPPAPAAEPPTAVSVQGAPTGEPDLIPVDSTKTFVGPNGTYYDERWRWMEWRGLARSWNWAAALTFGAWLAYRRLYGWAALYVAWLGALVMMAMSGASLWFLALVQLAIALICGAYGNTVYMQRFRQMALKVAQEQSEHAARLCALADSGGIDRQAVWCMVAAGVVIALLLIGLG